MKINIQGMVTGMSLRVSALTTVLLWRLSYLGEIALGSVKTNKGSEMLGPIEVLLATS